MKNRIPASSQGRTGILLAAATAMVMFSPPALAAEVQIVPVILTLTPTARSAVVTIKNDGKAEARFDLQVKAWSQTPLGEMVLAETDDIIVYPLVLAIAAGEERNLRVGIATPFEEVEKTYRLIVEEIPPAEKPEGATVVQILNKFLIPIFVTPSKAVQKLVVADLADNAGKVTFRLVNEGNVHERPDTVKLLGLGADGKEIFQQELAAWYVLAGGVREYTATVPKEACPAVRQLVVDVTLPPPRPPEPVRGRLEGPVTCAP